ncbi:MAG: hypothetical protein H6852_02640 [Geminicoccaceae bacterium]|jgi:hypothetical protein|nr:hypothetical protein [Geminicoccaceae bacterium]
MGLLVLAGCAGMNSLAGREGLVVPVKNYYADHATEEGGLCPTPLMRAITQTEILEETDERLVLRLRYTYQDRSFSSVEVDALGFIQPQSCVGFATRTFTISVGPEGGAAEVLEMSGPQRDIRKNFGVGGRTP